MNSLEDRYGTRVGIALRAVVIVLAAVWVYWPAIRGQWLWDDVPEIVENSAVHEAAGLGRIWLRPQGPDYFPLKTTVQWFEWRLWGDRPAGYHLTTIGLHVLSALLFWKLLSRLGVRLAWIGGLLFAVHPLAVESVAWISELKNTLSLVLLLSAMICYVEFDAIRNALHLYLGSIVFFLAAMLAKSSVVMFPVVLLLYAWWRRGRIARRDVGASAPFFAIALALGLVTVWFQDHRSISGVDLAIGGALSRGAGTGLAVAFYFARSVFPVGLLPIYPRWDLASPSVPQLLPWLGVAAVGAWLWTRRATWGRHALFGLGFFLLNLLPVLGFVPMAYLRISWVADHFAYLPLLGLVGLGVAFLPRPNALVAVLLAGLVAVLAVESRRYTRVFLNEEALWAYTVERNPNAWVARHGLGLALLRSGRLAEAQQQFEQTLRLNPALSSAHYNLGNTLAREEQRSAAILEYREAVRLKPDYTDAWYNLAGLLGEDDQLADSAAAYEAAIRLRPRFADAYVNDGNVLARMNRGADAVRQYQEALRLEPGAADVRNNLGGLLAGSGHLAEAQAQFEEALRLNPDYREARENLERVKAMERGGAGP